MITYTVISEIVDIYEKKCYYYEIKLQNIINREWSVTSELI